ncbi:MAG TPA: SOS response-associated peptidase [Candidatus Acidoferrum sp.]|nr:SOS response-associated peptidase [Candidatus Acidoferrum sp.]
MCGRYTLATQLELLEPRFGVDAGSAQHIPRYNIAPGQMVPVVTAENGRMLSMMRWGLVPSWAKDESVGYRMINARAETVAEKPSFRKALESRRCLVPADGFFEWRKELGGSVKTPVRFVLKDRSLFAFAGLWERWKQPDGKDLLTYTIITTGANELVRPIHDRMPVILGRSDEGRWLDVSTGKGKGPVDLLAPFPASEMEVYEVSTAVNSPRNDVPACIEPVL